MKAASIDIGTNTTRLAIVENNPFKVISKFRTVTRLGQNFSGNIIPEAKERVLSALKKYSNIIKENRVSSVRGVATSVIREAKNGREFVDEIYRKTGLKIDVINGEEEALLTLKGVISVLDKKIKNFLLLDIGGGSNEFTLIKDSEVLDSISLKFGVVFLYEKYVKNNPPENEEIISMENEIVDNLKIVAEKFRLTDYNDFHFVGTAGTVTTLSAIDLQLKNYIPEKINNHRIKKEFLIKTLQSMLSMTNNERGERYFIEKGREDVIVSGFLIIKNCMELFGFNNIISIDSGLLEGVAYDMIETLRCV